MLGQSSLTTSVLPPRGFLTAWDRPGRRGRGTGLQPLRGLRGAGGRALPLSRAGFRFGGFVSRGKSIKEKEKKRKEPRIIILK